MPLLLRLVEPTHVSRGTLPDRFSVPNDLEAVSNGTLANVIRQLSALSHHGEELFSDLISVASGIAQRAGNLQGRIDRLAVKVTQIDSMQDESPSIHESLNTKPFTSSLVFDQQVVSRNTLPPSMSKTYGICDPPPPLDKLNKYRDDNRNALTFYTDPSYFFDLWRQEMLKDTERAIVDRGKKPHKPKHEGQTRHKKRVRQPPNTRERQRDLAIEHGEYIMNPSPNEHGQRNTMNARNTMVDGPGQEQNGHYPSPPQQLDPNGRGPPGAYRGTMSYEEQAEYNNITNALSMSSQYDPYQRYYPYPSYEDSPPPLNNQMHQYNNRNSQNQQQKSVSVTMINGYRPTQPPPAPPLNHYIGSPPRNNLGTPPQGSSTPISNNMNITPNGNRMTGSAGGNRSTLQAHRDTLPPPPPPPSDNNSSINHLPPSFPPPMDDDLPPPPPTPMGMMDHHMMLRPPSLPDPDHLPPSPPPPPLDDIPEQIDTGAPPPPPPPPPVLGMNSNPNPSSLLLTNGNKKLRPTNNPPPIRDGRSELLKAIRDGIALRKVETVESKAEESKSSTYHDVASILARRVAVEMSDSDSGSSEYDSDAWDEASA